ncbi:MAG: mismatch repair protein Vsr [Verrucomicrobiales bacterium]|nr:mismatch repair protein Vsr [Verrucomicrobiales bacterium]
MSRIRGKANKDTELVLVAIFRQNKITGWRRHARVFGKPDFIFPKSKVAVFVDGCFWHRCPKHSNMPANNREFWLKKLTANETRDLLVVKTLQKQGWRVIRIWEHDLRKPKKLISRILGYLNKALID